MKLDYLKNSWRIYFANFGKIFSFTLSVAVLFLLGISSFLLISGFDFGITSILIFAFVFAPLFYCLQMMVGQVSAGKNVEYNEFYVPYKLYFAPSNKGLYSLIITFILTSLVVFISMSLGIFVYEMFNYEFMQNIYEKFQGQLTIEQINELTNTLMDAPGFIYVVLYSMIIPILFFFNRIKNRLMLCYFNMIVPLPSLITKSINNRLIKANKKQINECCFLGNLIFVAVFILGFVGTSVILNLFNEQLFNQVVIFLISLCGGILLSSFVLPPVLINYCFVADRLHPLYLESIKNEMLSLSKSISEDDPQKAIIDEMINNLNLNETNEKEDQDDLPN